jgi:hypothetical protein
MYRGKPNWIFAAVQAQARVSGIYLAVADYRIIGGGAKEIP